jgi:hypothetical protein
VKDKAGWLMFYTNRRADMTALGDIAWVHGTRIGVAASKDGKAWTYRGEAKIPYGGPDTTFWAPEIVTDGKTHHMFLTVVPGVFDSWNHPREIIHLTSRDLKAWTFVGKLDLGSDRVIDADIVKLPPGVSAASGGCGSRTSATAAASTMPTAATYRPGRSAASPFRRAAKGRWCFAGRIAGG